MLPDAPVVSYQEEAWSAVLLELEACMKAHWQEVAQDQDRMPLVLDYASYAALEQQGGLVVVTVRVDQELAGYFISFVRHHLHYAETLCAYVDVYYLKPTFRGEGLLALGLFRHAEAVLRAKGVQKVFAGTKVYLDASALFQRCQWVETERLYTKWIGD